MNERTTQTVKNPRAVRQVTREVLLDKYGTPTLRERLSHLRLGSKRRQQGEQQRTDQQGAGQPQEQSEQPPSQRHQGAPTWWVMKTSTEIVRVRYTLPLVALTLLGLWKSGRRADALYLFGVVAASQAAEGILKKTVDERRPEQGGAGKEPNSSFPSDHGVYTATLGTAAVLLTWSSPYRNLALLVGPGLSLLTGLSRLYFRRHHTRDVVVGWVIGAGMAYLGRLIRDRYARSERP